MRYLPTGKQMREADLYTIQEVGIPSLVLMEHAALGVVESMQQAGVDCSNVLVVCGSGNNGGDGYAIARLLCLKGSNVDIFFVGKEASRSEENKVQKDKAENYDIKVVQSLNMRKYTVVIDAIFGTGLKRNIEGEYAEVICGLNEISAYKVAVDIPSGINDTTGEVMGVAFKADMTVAIAFIKRGLVLHPGFQYAGKIVTTDIGISEDALSRKETLTYGYEVEDLHTFFPKRKPNSHKGTYGKVLMIVGSKGMSGAAYLSARAAYEVGAGLVQIYTAEENRVILQQLLPEAIVTTYQEYNEKELDTLIEWADVVGIGSGLGKSDVARALVNRTLEQVKCCCVIDADALNIISENDEMKLLLRENMILTPHMKEMSRLLDCEVKEIAANRIEILNQYLEQYPVVCVMKDARTLVGKQGNDLYLNLSGTSAMAKAGAGDVLTGIIAGIEGQTKDCYISACLGVYLHGLAGEKARDKKGNYSVLASDIIDGIHKVLKEI